MFINVKWKNELLKLVSSYHRSHFPKTFRIFFHLNLLFIKDILGMVISALPFYTTMFNSEEKLPIVETVPSELELGELGQSN